MITCFRGLQPTSTLITVPKIPRCAVIPSAYDPFFSYQDTAHSPLHAIAPLCSKGGELHEVLIPAGAETLVIGQIEVSQGGVKMPQ